jgi:hypothetical protein
MATAWLTSIFAKIQSMHNHRQAAKGDGAKADAQMYAVAQLEPINAFLGVRKYEAKKALDYLFDGADAKDLARMVIRGEDLAQAALITDLRAKLDL